MLKKITIQNYILIENLEIEFDENFSVLTGETGSGKSILLGAIGLALGNRADSNVIKNQEQKCVVEAIFNLENYNLKFIFEENQIEYDHESIFRREITPQGKSRAFINDTPVNINTLKEIGTKIVDIHSQHQTLNINDPQFQLQMVDIIAQNQPLLANYHQQWTELSRIQNEIKSLQEKKKQLEEKQDFIKYQYEQLHNAKLQAEELRDLETELNQLTHSEQIKTELTTAIELLDNEEIGIIKSMKRLENTFGSLSQFIPSLSEKQQWLENNKIELQETLRELTKINDNLEFDPQRQEIIESRLSLLYDLLAKHHKTEISELIELEKHLEQELVKVENFDFEMESLRKKELQQLEAVRKSAEEISQRRKNSFHEIESYIAENLKNLGMPSAKFRIEHTTKEPCPTGIDTVKFLFSSNKQIEPDDISKVASGGELSRIMLVIKSLIAHRLTLPTIIFDEIDTGISGEIADKMGKIMATMSQTMQVISISHLPQIAAKAQNHYLVYKTEENHTTTTRIRRLSMEERVLEIARMLSGEQLGQAAIENAKELLSK
ncbi:MAG TPA: DNA repair protein RecN [Salinivirgaceae bacterium]|nr:DNA repair protein RecN [Salinivirgaceae bacterium]